MDISNETCVQKVIFRFFYQIPKTDKKALNKSVIISEAPAIIRAQKQYLEIRLERIAQMVEILLQSHEDWLAFERKDYFQMETVSFDFNEAVNFLSQNGFSKEEYSLEVEYTRKWGVL